jgi:asparagine synthase (glutamine-hydrolysing)
MTMTSATAAMPRHVAHAGAAMALRPSSRHGGLAADGRVLAMIDGYPEWSDPELAAFARDFGHAAALARAFRHHGEHLLDRLHGTFVVAVVDRDSGGGLLAIDRLGIRRLCYARPAGGGIVFASETDTVAAHPAVASTLSAQAVCDYLLHYRVSAPDTIYEEQRKLRCAECVIVDGAAAHTRFYWRMPYDETNHARFADLRHGLMTTLRAAVDRAIDGEDHGRVGAFLSGGLDSSTVAGLLGAAVGGGGKAFTIGFDVPGYDETPYAETAARHFGLDHHVYRMTPDDVADALAQVSQAYDEPFGNTSALPAFVCARLARDHGIDLLLAGDGGDELFAGNAWYTKILVLDLYGRLPPAVRRHVLEPIVFGFPGGSRFGPIRKARNYITRARIPMPDRGFEAEALLLMPAEEMMARHVVDRIDVRHVHDVLHDAWQRTPSTSVLQRMMCFDQQIVLADCDLPKVNVTAGLAGVRVRYPMLDEQVATFSASVPPGVMIRRFRLRDFYKRAVDGFLPPTIINKKKQGFGLPLAPWLKSSRPLQDMVLEAAKAFSARGLVREDYVDRLLADIRETDFTGPGVGSVYDLAMMELWAQRRLVPGARLPM